MTKQGNNSQKNSSIFMFLCFYVINLHIFLVYAEAEYGLFCFQNKSFLPSHLLSDVISTIHNSSLRHNRHQPTFRITTGSSCRRTTLVMNGDIGANATSLLFHRGGSPVMFATIKLSFFNISSFNL